MSEELRDGTAFWLAEYYDNDEWLRLDETERAGYLDQASALLNFMREPLARLYFAPGSPSDEQVELGARALADEFYGVGWDEASERHDNLRSEARIVLEAALAAAPAPKIPLNEHGEVPLSWIFGETETEEQP